MKSNLTRRLVALSLAIRCEELPERARILARQCLLDFVAVTAAGQQDALVVKLREDLLSQGGHAQARIIGGETTIALYHAALINGTAAHALDYDDVNYALMGHPTVPVLPALCALAELIAAEGNAVIAAFIAGYEFECRVGCLLGSSLYAQGFHATSTIGALGAAVACSHLLGLSETATAHAVGIAATRSAGLKSMFGTDCKPLHAGHAAQIGVHAARLAAQGFTSRTDSLECAQGFAATHALETNEVAALAVPAMGLHLHANLFKYHAACFETHATIESCLKLREIGLVHTDVQSIVVRVNPYCDKICNLPSPQTGLEAKFSLRQTAAFAFAGLNTGDPAIFNSATLHEPQVRAWFTKISVVLDDAVKPSHAEVLLTDRRGGAHTARHNASEPQNDLAYQQKRLTDKARALLTGVYPKPDEIIGAIEAVDAPGGFERLSSAW